MIKRVIKLISALAIIALIAMGIIHLFQPKTSHPPANSPGISLPAPAPAPPSHASRQLSPGGHSLRTVNRPPSNVLPVNLRILLGLAGVPADFRNRHSSLKNLTRRLPASEIAPLLTFLETPFGDSQGLRPMELSALKNDILDVLMRQDQPVPGLGARVAAMCRNPEHDDIWRDYCIQYLAGCYENSRAAGSVAEQEAVSAACWAAVTQSGKSLSGTALIGLESLSRKYPEIDRERVGQTAAALADDQRACEATRITALRLSGMLKRSEALDAARFVAQVGATVPLRMAAIATLGELGDFADLIYLQETAVQDTPRFKPIIEAAVQNLRTRLGLKKG